MPKKGTLIFFCGKMGAGKSTAAKKMAQEAQAILVSEDDWLAALYPEEINSFDDYLRYSARLKPLIKAHVRNLLLAGVSVVMDFPGNTKKQRAWFKGIYLEDQIPHRLIYLQAEDELCLQRLAQRRQELPERAQFDTEEVFYQVTAFFQAPYEDEVFNLIVLPQSE